MKTALQIRTAIACAGLTRQQVADAAQVAVTSVRRYETGGNITRETAQKIDDALSRYVVFLNVGDVVQSPTVAGLSELDQQSQHDEPAEPVAR